MVEPDRPTLLALAALHELADAAHAGPIAPSVITRALLALLFARSNGDRKPYDAFWRQLAWPGLGEPSDPYQRSTYATTRLWKIYRTLGLEPQSVALNQQIDALRDGKDDAGPETLRLVTRWQRGEYPTMRDVGAA